MANMYFRTFRRMALLSVIRKSALISLLVTLCTLSFTGCKDDDISKLPTIKGEIVSYNEFGAAMLSFTVQDMTSAGFSLGDVISVAVAGQDIVMPYYDGYYTANGEYLCVAYPSYPSICFTANNTGLPEELTGLEGQPVVIRMVEKGGKYDVQQALGMKYGNDRAKYPSDEAFANARAVTAGNIAGGVLHRSSSPFCNDINRARYVSEYLERNHVKTVLNLADTKELIESYDLPPYSRSLWESGNVILCPLKADPTATDFNNRLVEALKQLPSHPAPYVVHCLEGKDRTGYVCALLEGLCGASYDEIVADYLVTYNNYYEVSPDDDVCATLVRLRLNPCLMHYAGVDDESKLPGIDYAAAFSAFLLSHGMTAEQIHSLVHALTTPAP